MFVLAAGRGKRLGFDVPKVLVPLGGLPIIAYGLRAIVASRPRSIVVVVGHEGVRVANAVESILADSGCPWSIVDQSPLLGTGHAVRLAISKSHPTTTHVLSLNADDSALLSSSAIDGLMASHRRSETVASIVVSRVKASFSFGRVCAVPPHTIDFLSYRACVAQQALDLPVATGIYAFKTKWLQDNCDCFSEDHRGELPIYQLMERARDSGDAWGVIELPEHFWCSSNTPEEFEELKARFLNESADD